MAEDSGNEDQWLYGDSNQEPPESENKDEQKAVAIDEVTAEVTQQGENTGESDQVFKRALRLK
jgi:hypothetical protein